MKHLDKWSILAGLRFFLASVVALNHLKEYANLGCFSFLPNFGAFEAILGFLLISGYSVSVSYLKEPKGFLLRRLGRLYPVYLTSLVITLSVGILFQHEQAPSILALLLNGMFLNQIFTTTSLVGPAWSLSLEFWLYCLAPLLLIVRPAWCRPIVYISFVSYLSYTVCRTLFHMPYYSGIGGGANLVLLAFAWICGLRLARGQEDIPSTMWDIRVIFIVHILLAVCIQLFFCLKHHALGAFLQEDILKFSLQSLTLLIVYYVFSKCVLSAQPGRTKSKLLRFLGDASYPLYLIHIPIYVLLSKTSLHSAAVYYLTALAASILVYVVVDSYSRKRHIQMAAA